MGKEDKKKPEPSPLEKIVAGVAGTGPDVFPRERVDRYRAAVTHLIDEMRRWLAPWIEGGKVKAHPVQEVDRFEQGHAYRVQTWSFNLGHHYVAIEPRGTWVIGAYGRADLVSQPGSRVSLTLDDAFEWYMPKRGRTKYTFEKLDETVFAEALKRALQTAR